MAFAESEYVQNSGNSNYNSLQISAERRARDVTYLLSYTYSKSLDDVGALWDPRDPLRDYGQSSWDMRHNFVASYTWNLPFAHFFGPHRYSNGWHITGISRFNTGFPVSLAEQRRRRSDQHRSRLSQPGGSPAEVESTSSLDITTSTPRPSPVTSAAALKSVA